MDTMTVRMLALQTLTALCACVVLLHIGAARAQPENTGQVQEPLVTPRPPIDLQTQEQFGLLTLSNPEGTCSASMLNDYWAITAAHCVFSAKTTCPQFAANQISLTSNWPGNIKTVQALQVISYGTPTTCPTNMLGSPDDVALLQVGLHDFGRPDARSMKLQEQRPMANLTVTAYGRGINALAFQVGSLATPTVLDGKFRSADFDIASISPNSSDPPTTFSYAGNKGATIAGGDSGGPSYIQDWDDPLSIRRKLEFRLIGVHSWCSTQCLPGKICTPPANPWTWVASISQCTDAAILPIRSAILAAIEAVPPDTGAVGTFPTTPDSVLRHKRALYAVSIDEPLIAPAGAAIDVQLTFKGCHAVRVTEGCPVTPDLEQWGYDPATHRLLHAASGKCLNISGARRDAGSPIILYPCSGAPNEKWTLVERAGTALWSIKSDLTGMCLQAVRGRATSPAPRGVRLLPVATLVQMPCDGGNAQRFNNVDAAWSQRNGPH
jgi:hypothetical protein